MDAMPPPPDTPIGSPGPLPMRCSPAIDALTVALAKAQGAFPAIEKAKTARIATKTGAAYSYTYADLASILSAVRKPLSENALAVMQPIRVNGRTVSVTTILAHGSGQWVADELAMPIGDATDPRSVASGITYARRYSLIALLGIAPADEDDDGAQAGDRDGGPGPHPPEQPTEPRPSRKTRSTPAVAQAPALEASPTEKAASYVPAVISVAQRRRFFAIAREHGWTNDQLKPWLQTYGIASTTAMLTSQYDALCDALAIEAPPAADREPGEDDA